MTLEEYFETVSGVGILATADSKGNVDVALYARPHVIDETTIAFIMTERRSHTNLESNPRAAYLFKEEGERYVGKRLYLTRIREEKDSELISSLRRKKLVATSSENHGHTRYLVYFQIDEVRSLVGNHDDAQ